MESEKENRIKELLIKGVSNGVYPGAVLLVAHGGEIVYFQEVGQRSLIRTAGSMTKDTIFDLASLTKPLATTLALMRCVDERKIDIDQTLKKLLPVTLPKDKQDLSLRLILSHSAGFADWKSFYLKLIEFEPEKRKGLIRNWIMEAPLVYRPGKNTLYSDLGFMILEWVIEQCTGMPMHIFLDRNFYSPLSIKKIFLSGTSPPSHISEDQFAATEDCSWRKKIIQGVVHDENAYALGGYSGHAGLFGIAEEVYILADLLRTHSNGQKADCLRPETVRTFFSQQKLVKGSTWALGWDTPSQKDSSSGRYFTSKSVGHLGYTGTSIWMDLDQDVILIFLTNRIHPTRNNEKIKTFRPILHDKVMEDIVFNGRD